MLLCNSDWISYSVQATSGCVDAAALLMMAIRCYDCSRLSSCPPAEAERHVNTIMATLRAGWEPKQTGHWSCGTAVSLRPRSIISVKGGRREGGGDLTPFVVIWRKKERNNNTFFLILRNSDEIIFKKIPHRRAAVVICCPLLIASSKTH